MRVLVTGAHGFVGRVLCRQLRERGIEMRAAVRRRGGALGDDIAEVGELRETGLRATVVFFCLTQAT